MASKLNFKKDFPIFSKHKDLVYLDSTATSLKPKIVIDELVKYYREYSSNVARGIYKIAEQATGRYEKARENIAQFIGARQASEIIFTRGTTESLNLICASLGNQIIGEGDEIVATVMEHHSNFVPWQQLAIRKKAKFKVMDITEEGRLDIESKKSKVKSQNQKLKVKSIDLSKCISGKTKILALTYVSNVLGTINPVKEIVKAAKKINPHIYIIVDAAQAVPHMRVNVADLGCDFLCFSGHKMLGPTGIGVLWGKYDILDRLTPYHYGGEMIEEVHRTHSSFKKPPHKFEAGTPAIAQAIGLSAAADYLNAVGMDNVFEHDRLLVKFAYKSLQEEFKDQVKILGQGNLQDRCGSIAFNMASIHPHDIAQILDDYNIAIRVGSHCAMPLHKRLGVGSSARVSFYLYNQNDDVKRFLSALKKVIKIFS